MYAVLHVFILADWPKDVDLLLLLLLTFLLSVCPHQFMSDDAVIPMMRRGVVMLEKCTPSGGLAASAGEGTSRPVAPPLLPPIAHLRVPPSVPCFATGGLPQGAYVKSPYGIRAAYPYLLMHWCLLPIDVFP